MPIEVRELIIRTEVDASAQAGGAPSGGGASDKQALIQECVEQVLEKLKQKKER